MICIYFFVLFLIILNRVIYFCAQGTFIDNGEVNARMNFHMENKRKIFEFFKRKIVREVKKKRKKLTE